MALNWLINFWREFLIAAIRGQSDIPAHAWLYAIRERIYRFLLERYGSQPETPADRAPARYPTRRPAWMKVTPKNVEPSGAFPPRSPAELRGKLSSISAANSAARNRRRWRWF